MTDDCHSSPRIPNLDFPCGKCGEPGHAPWTCEEVAVIRRNSMSATLVEGYRGGGCVECWQLEPSVAKALGCPHESSPLSHADIRRAIASAPCDAPDVEERIVAYAKVFGWCLLLSGVVAGIALLVAALGGKP